MAEKNARGGVVQTRLTPDVPLFPYAHSSSLIFREALPLSEIPAPNVHSHAHGSAIPNWQAAEATQVSGSGGQINETWSPRTLRPAATYTVVVLSLDREGNADTGSNTGALEDVMLSEIRQPQNDKYWRIPLT